MDATVLVPLTRGLFATIDAADADLILQYKWHSFAGTSRTRYARTRVDGKSVAMHRLIMNPPAGLQVDHVNCNGLDNRRENLRLATSGQNHCNTAAYSGSVSKYKGVSWHKNRKRWQAHIGLNNKPRYIGQFATELEAAIAYNAAARELHGEFARLNDVPEQLQLT